MRRIANGRPSTASFYRRKGRGQTPPHAPTRLAERKNIMKGHLKRISVARLAAVAAVSVSGLFAARASAGDVSIGIRIGEPAPPPPPVVVRETTVIDYNTYVVGFRRTLYDADWRLRVAQTD